jgi:pimeloyl-ACP methyl ester carboxylesterase
MTRNGRDFDYLAAALEKDYRVVCPDVVGRGESEWLKVKQDYAYPTYCADMAALMARLGAEQVDWVGTSMGGMIGMLLAAMPNAPIRRLVLNDVGPFISKAALERIAEYVGSDPRFKSVEEVESYMREINAPFGPLTDEQWQHYARYYSRPTEEGDIGLNYDPAIGLPLKNAPLEDVDLWPVWDAVHCPVLLLRGEDSDVLLAQTAREMRDRGPGAKLVELSGIGHAPALMAQDQIDIVRDWLASDG